MNQEAQVHETEIQIDQAREAVAKRDALNRLIDNKDFSMVIHKGYFEEEASRLVLSRPESALQTDEARRGNDEGITGVGQLFQYFRRISTQGRQAEEAIQDYMVDLDTLEAEGNA